MRDVDAGRPARLRALWRNRIATGAAIVLPLIIIAVAFLIVQQTRTSNNLRQEEIASQVRHSLLLEVLSAHQDIETGSRGFVITGNDAFLEPFVKGQRDLDRILPRMRRDYADKPEALALIDQIELYSHEKRAFTAATIALRRDQGAQFAAGRVGAGEGKRIMDAIRARIGKLLDLEARWLSASASQSNTAITRLRVMTFGALAVLTVLLFVAGAAIYNSLRARDAALGIAEDLSVRRRAILQNAMDGIVTLNPSGSIESANIAMTRMFGYSETELARRDFGKLFSSQAPVGQMAVDLREMKLVSGEAGTAREWVGLHRDGSEFPVEVAFSATQLNEGLRYVAILRDVTERKRVERMKSEFVSTVSHELRTPLTSIAGSLGLLAGGAAGELPPKASRLIDIAHGNAERLVRLINDILDIEKIESGKMPFDNRDLDLKASVSSAIEEIRAYAARYEVHVALSAPMTPLVVKADRDRLAQVFTNLLSNACKFSPKGGSVEVTIGANGPYYRVTVADHGPGIPPGFRGRIFGKFAQADSSDTRQRGGTGLGLSIVREIVLRLGGRVSFDTETDGDRTGTSFHVDLPMANRVSAKRADEHPSLLVCGKEAGTALTGALRRAGYAVTLARSMDAARSALGDERFDGIVVDMGLEGGGSIETIRMVRTSPLNAATPLLALGGKAGAGELEGDAALVLDWLRKPLDVARLVESVESARAHMTGKRAQVLHVEDDPDVANLVREALANHAEVDSAEGLASARAALAARTYDLVIVDLGLADGDGIEVLRALRGDGEAPPVPVIVFSAQDADPETASQVDAFLTKARTPISTLVNLVESLTGKAADKSVDRAAATAPAPGDA